MVAELARLDPGRALDLGAGEGADAVWLAERGWEVTAVDFSPAAISWINQVASSRGLPITAIVADVLEYQPDHLYDLVTMCYVHLSANGRGKMLSSGSAALAPGGTLLFIGIAPSDDPAYAAHQHLFATPGEIAEGLLGLAIERAEAIHRKIPYPGDVYEGEGVIVRARRVG